MGPYRFGRVRWRTYRPFQTSHGCVCCSITLRRSKTRAKPGRSPIRCARFCSWWCAGRSRTATTMRTSSIGARRICRFSAIPALVERLDLEGALVSIDAMGCNPNIAQSILDAKADYLLAVKANQPTLHAEIKSYFQTAPSLEVEQIETVGKDHGRVEVRTHTVSHVVDWYTAQRSYPGAPRFPQLTTIAMVESRIERGDKIETEQRSYISSRPLSAAAFADGARGHWGIENNLHWTLDVTFNEDQSRLRVGHGANNMAVVRHFALNLVRQIADKRSIKRRRKCAAWDPKYLLEILGPLRR